MSYIDFKNIYDNPETMLQLMEDLEKCGFKPEFTFEDKILKLIIKKSSGLHSSNLPPCSAHVRSEKFY